MVHVSPAPVTYANDIWPGDGPSDARNATSSSFV